MPDLQRGDRSDAVARLQALLCVAGFDAKPIDGDFGPGTERAVRACQAANDLPATGRADDAAQRAIGMDQPDRTKDLDPCVAAVTADLVRRMFPAATPARNIEHHLPAVLGALADAGLDDKDMVLMALATIRAESEGFVPIDEGRSQFNTDPGAPPFNRYEPGTSAGRRLGNTEPGDGARFKGRGFIQLTGRDNYGRIGAEIGLGNGLLDTPDRANEPEIAAAILAAFLKAKHSRIKYALLGRDLATARKLVNGGSHGLDRFEDSFTRGADLLQGA
jgi:peptidoglycan L-alanyl-D-glutamate endopeptidase CwlK